MKQILLATVLLFSAGLLSAETVKSPNGAMVLNVELKNGVPVIDWTTKTRQSLKRVSLVLNLKMARILRTGLNLQKQKRHRSMKAGILFGVK